jgi:hypothetical protein
MWYTTQKMEITRRTLEESTGFVLCLISETSGELGWVLTLAIVSILSAAVGAVVMVTVLQCRK